MLCFCCDAYFPKFLVQILHVSTYTLTDNTKVMIFHFLTLWCRCAE